MQGSLLNPDEIRDISPQVLDERGRLQVLPASFWESVTPAERAMFCHRHAVYGIPTVELVEHLAALINGRKAIEIGAGNGVLADALGITATDNRMQTLAKYRRIYEQSGQPVITYGRNVIGIDAHQAVRRCEPEVVIASWVTHKYNPRRHWAGGNEIGVDEEDVIANCGQYVFIGNTKVHEPKSIWELPHTREELPFLYSRAVNGSPDFVAVWAGGRGD